MTILSTPDWHSHERFEGLSVWVVVLLRQLVNRVSESSLSDQFGSSTTHVVCDINFLFA